jgi:hypothetical protein
VSQPLWRCTSNGLTPAAGFVPEVKRTLGAGVDGCFSMSDLSVVDELLLCSVIEERAVRGGVSFAIIINWKDCCSKEMWKWKKENAGKDGSSLICPQRRSFPKDVGNDEKLIVGRTLKQRCGTIPRCWDCQHLAIDHHSSACVRPMPRMSCGQYPENHSREPIPPRKRLTVARSSLPRILRMVIKEWRNGACYDANPSHKDAMLTRRM